MRADFSVLDLPPADAAAALSHVDYELYRSIPMEEFLSRSFMKGMQLCVGVFVCLYV